MGKRLKSKKGVLFTAILVMMASTLLTLSILMFYNSLSSEDRFIELASLDTMHNIYSSIEKSIRDIFYLSFGNDIIDINQNENTIVLKDTLPSLLPLFRDNINNFKSFINSKFNFIHLNYSYMLDKTLIIYPYNVTYIELDSYQDSTPAIIIIPSNHSLLEGYDISFEEPIISCPSAPIIYEGNFNVYTHCGNFQLDPHEFNNLDVIEVFQPYESYYHLRFGTVDPSYPLPPGSLVILRLNQGSLFSTPIIKIYFKDMDEPITVEFPGDVIDVDIAGSNVRKKGSVRII